MNNIQYTYNQPPMGQRMMPPPMPPRGRWQRRAMNAIGRVGKITFPKWVTQYGVIVYVLALAIVSFMYSAYSIPWYFMLSGVVAVMVFFLYGSTMIEQTSVQKIQRGKKFEHRIFWISLSIRVVWTVLIYMLFMENYGDAFGFENGDPTFYNDQGNAFAEAIRKGNFKEEWNYISARIDISDLGYPAYLGFIYYLTDNSIMAVRLIKCLLSALTVVFIYRLALRNFNQQTARIVAIFVALWPNFWYYCGTHLKETEMTFLGVLFVEQADQMLRSRQFTAWKVAPVLLIGASLLTLRTPLALVAFLSLVFSVVMSSSRVVSWGKRIIVGGLVLVLVAVTLGNRIQEEAKGLFDTVQTDQQEKNMQWRSRRHDGNAFAKYAGKAVFAPLIFTIPFPSMVRPFDGQDSLQLLNGGNFVKNIISFFTIFAIFALLLSGKWRDHLLPMSFLLGYLVVLTMSVFAQSERFHQPAMPFEFMFAAYGLSVAVTKPKYKRWFTYWCVLMFVACIAWNWFKIAGRGLT